jgi:hypothetical protein
MNVRVASIQFYAAVMRTALCCLSHLSKDSTSDANERQTVFTLQSIKISVHRLFCFARAHARAHERINFKTATDRVFYGRGIAFVTSATAQQTVVAHRALQVCVRRMGSVVVLLLLVSAYLRSLLLLHPSERLESDCSIVTLLHAACGHKLSGESKRRSSI